MSGWRANCRACDHEVSGPAGDTNQSPLAKTLLLANLHYSGASMTTALRSERTNVNFSEYTGAGAAPKQGQVAQTIPVRPCLPPRVNEVRAPLVKASTSLHAPGQPTTPTHLRLLCQRFSLSSSPVFLRTMRSSAFFLTYITSLTVPHCTEYNAHCTAS